MDEMERSRPPTETPLQPRASGSPVPLTAGQLSFWNWWNKQGMPLSKRICVTGTHIRGSLNTEILRDSLEALVQRHEPLRTRFLVVDGIPRQHIDAFVPCTFELIQLATPPEYASIEVNRIAQQLSEENVHLSVGPLFAARLLQLSAREHVLILALDHMIADAVSEEIANRELWILYNQAIQGAPFALPQLPAQFADYAIWQQHMHDAWVEEHGVYWRERLANAPRIKIPVSKELSDVHNAVGAVIQIPLGPELSSRLEELAWREDTLLSFVVLTIYVIAMSRLCGASDLVLGVVLHGRDRRDIRNMMGFIARGVFLRIEIVKNDSFLDVLNRLRAEFDSALIHQDFGWVPNLVPVETDVFFNWLSSRCPRWSASYQLGTDHEIRLQEAPLKVAIPMKFGCIFSHTAAGIYFDLHYLPEIVAKNTIEEFLNCLQLCAEKFAECPSACIYSFFGAQSDASRVS